MTGSCAAACVLGSHDLPPNSHSKVKLLKFICKSEIVINSIL